MQKYNHICQADYETVSGPDWPPFAQFQLHADVPDFVYAELDTMIRPPEGFSHPSFCVLPFYAIEYPQKTPCCLLPNPISPEEINDMKNQMLQGQRPTACAKCWFLEDAGIKSDRLIKNETLDFFSNIDLEQMIEDCKQGKNKKIHYKIETNNTCNAACVTCDGRSSSTWNKILEKNNLPSYKNWKALPEEITHWVDYDHAQFVNFHGGESFLSTANFYILEQLINHNNTDCFVSFVTNGSFSLNARQKEILTKFKNLNFCFSIDGIGPVFEYVRWPLKWDDIENNILWCRANNIGVGVSYTLSNMNLIYHTETTKWFEDNKINYLVNPVYWPNHFRPQALPADVKQQLAQQPNAAAIQVWLTHSPDNGEHYQQFREEIAKQDNMKNIHIQDYLPELVQLLQW